MGDATPAADVGAMLIMEMVLHGWDVAKASGQDYACDAAAAEAVLDTGTAQAELFRKYQGFADADRGPQATARPSTAPCACPAATRAGNPAKPAI